MEDLSKFKNTLVGCEHVNSRCKFTPTYVNEGSESDRLSVCELRHNLHLICDNCRYYNKCRSEYENRKCK